MPERAELPGAPEPEDRVVAHVDMDCFYAACERLREPELRGEPVVVGMGYEPGETIGAVATASYEAREFGVESAMPIEHALQQLPRRADRDPDDEGAPDESGFYRPVDMAFYEETASEVKAILHDAAETVREVSIDEAYLDLTPEGWDGARAAVERLRERIREEVGVVASVGVAPNMSTAKIASDHEKPDGLVVVRPDEVRDFLAPIPVEDLHGVGPVTARTLRERGIETAGDVAGADPVALEREFGERGRELYDRARGRDDRAVEPQGRSKSISSESALEPTEDTGTKRDLVRSLAADVAERARAKDALYRTIGVKVVQPPFDVNTRARSLSGPVDDPDLVEAVALDLLTEFEDSRVRKLGVRVSNLDFTAAEQATIDGWGGPGTTDGADGDAGTAGGDPTDGGQETIDGWSEVEASARGTDEGEGAAARADATSGSPQGTDDSGAERTRHVRWGQTRLPEFADE
ncbi:DNA polymerase IV [Haloglomus litoreum]|uniref:DNA polymerase IV n=1 Tax=Haloglomus litoreum TaxID=3034026 RepID=UPI0023E78BA6|nr:DNA polymerase IV [Haloglomus sp. DT116]